MHRLRDLLRRRVPEGASCEGPDFPDHGGLVAIAVLPLACYEPPPVVFRSSAYVLVLLAGCKDPPSKVTPPAQAAAVVVKDAGGATLAELRPGRPCRATIGPQELLVGGPPLLAMLGTTKWTGADEPNGTVLVRDTERIARVFPVGDPSTGAVFDLHGIAQVRVTVTGQTATVENKASIPVRKLTRAGETITSSDPAFTITGTDDLILAALLSAPELLPEVRMLAACERVLVKGLK